MTKDLCVGALGFSGNYGNINLTELTKNLKYIFRNYDLLDLSTDYGINYNILGTLKSLNIKDSDTSIIYKVGCNLFEAYNANKLFNDSLKDINYFSPEKINSILIHRPSIDKLSSDIKFINLIKGEYPSSLIGISTNSIELFNAYNKEVDIDIIQMALNPLDFLFNQTLIDKIYKSDTKIQVRSVLSNGLLSGKYNENTEFSDIMRSRLSTKTNNEKYKRRIQVSLNLIDYICKNYSVNIKDIPIFLYSLFEDMKNVQCVIRGASSFDQLVNNRKKVNICTHIKEDLFNKMLKEWSCEYV